MKKSALIAALLCAVSSGVYAASDVTLYGVVDGAVSVSKAKAKQLEWALTTASGPVPASASKATKI